MTGLILLMSVLLFWNVRPAGEQFSSSIERGQKHDINCSLSEGRGVTRPRTSIYADDQGSDLVNFDSFVECRRNFLAVHDDSRKAAAFLANVDELSQLIARKLQSESSGKTWRIRTVFRSKVLGEKVFSTVAYRLKSAGLKVSNQLPDSTELCPEQEASSGLFVLAYDDLQQKMHIGPCRANQVEWWFHEES